jgi:hypothetical protein
MQMSSKHYLTKLIVASLLEVTSMQSTPNGAQGLKLPKGVSYTRLLQTLDVRSSLLANQRIGPQIQKKLPDVIDLFVVKNISTNY